jgi:allophanate hydrolase subunit 2
MPTVTPAGDRAELIEFDADVSAAQLHAHAAEMRSPCIVGSRSLYVIHGGGQALRLAGQAREPVLHTIDVNFINDWRKADGVRLTARYLGFRAGFAYLDGWPREWAMPRQPTSRPVKRGSFAVAGSVAGFYTIDSPGGWNILGTTDALLWDARRNPPNLIEAGDEIVLRAVDRQMHPPENIEELPPEPIEGVTIEGKFATIVSLPDYSRIASGRSPGGAFDEASAIAANRAVGNRDDAPVIECAMLGPKVRFREPRVVAWFGAECDLPQGEPFETTEVNVGRIRNGLRGWLAVRDVAPASNDTPLIRASRTFSRREKDLDEAGSLVRSLAEIPLPPGEGGRRPGEGGVINQSAALRSRYPARGDRSVIRIVPGPHQPSIENIECEVTPQLNRVGIRLRPLQPINIAAPADLPSCGMQFGTIQLHPDGSLVAMGPDHPITGGYLQPMTVRWDERWKLAQLAPGERVRFLTE